MKIIHILSFYLGGRKGHPIGVSSVTTTRYVL